MEVIPRVGDEFDEWGGSRVRMQAAAAAAACAKRAVDQNQSKPIPDNVNRRLRLSASDRSNRICGRRSKQTARLKHKKQTQKPRQRR
ncbi:hypothetical protein AS026_29535 [Rhizobium altiplani]|nr:hypothetical protein AS026_29535 [Rhizobium altiplani]